MPAGVGGGGGCGKLKMHVHGMNLGFMHATNVIGCQQVWYKAATTSLCAQASFGLRLLLRVKGSLKLEHHAFAVKACRLCQTHNHSCPRSSRLGIYYLDADNTGP